MGEQLRHGRVDNASAQTWQMSGRPAWLAFEKKDGRPFWAAARSIACQKCVAKIILRAKILLRSRLGQAKKYEDASVNGYKQHPATREFAARAAPFGQYWLEIIAFDLALWVGFVLLVRVILVASG